MAHVSLASSARGSLRQPTQQPSPSTAIAEGSLAWEPVLLRLRGPNFRNKYLGCTSAILGYSRLFSAIPRLDLNCISANRGYISAISRLYLGCISAISAICLSRALLYVSAVCNSVRWAERSEGKSVGEGVSRRKQRRPHLRSCASVGGCCEFQNPLNHQACRASHDSDSH